MTVVPLPRRTAGGALVVGPRAASVGGAAPARSPLPPPGGRGGAIRRRQWRQRCAGLAAAAAAATAAAGATASVAAFSVGGARAQGARALPAHGLGPQALAARARSVAPPPWGRRPLRPSDSVWPSPDAVAAPLPRARLAAAGGSFSSWSSSSSAPPPAPSGGAGSGEDEGGDGGSRSAALAFSFLLGSAGNKILLRLLLVLVAPYSYFLGVITNLMYVVTFGAQVCVQSARNVPGVADSLRFALLGSHGRRLGRGRLCIALAGLCEAVAFLTMPVFAARLPGTLIPVMAQGLLLFSVLFSTLLLGRRFDALQLFGVGIVVAGVGVCTLQMSAPAAGAAAAGGEAVALGDAMGLFGAYAFIALSLSLKELAFKTYSRSPEVAKGDSLRAEVVNFATALWQGCGLVLLWPVASLFLPPGTGISASDYFAKGTKSLLAALPWLSSYLAVNLAYTVVTTVVLKRLSAVLMLLTNVLNVPLVSLFFCLNLPLLGAAPFRWSFVAGLCIIICGLLIYNHRSFRKTPT